MVTISGWAVLLSSAPPNCVGHGAVVSATSLRGCMLSDLSQLSLYRRAPTVPHRWALDVGCTMVWSGMPPVRTARSFLSGKSGHMDGGLSGFCAYNILSLPPSLRLGVYQVCHGSAGGPYPAPAIHCSHRIHRHVWGPNFGPEFRRLHQRQRRRRSTSRSTSIFWTDSIHARSA